jgi:hypothetical protein
MVAQASLAASFAGFGSATLAGRMSPGPGVSWALGTASADEVSARLALRGVSGGAQDQQVVWLDPVSGLELALRRRTRAVGPTEAAATFVTYEATVTNRGGQTVGHLRDLHVADWTFAPRDESQRYRYEALTYAGGEWYGSPFWTGPDWTRVGRDWQHTGENVGSVRVFTAPRAGLVRLTGRVRKADTNGGDGVGGAIRVHGRTLWQAEIDAADATGLEHDVAIEVRSGDPIRFVLTKRQTITCDTTRWDPTVTYSDGQAFRASEGFSDQAGLWGYELEQDTWSGAGGATVEVRTATFAARSARLSDQPVRLSAGAGEEGLLPLWVILDAGGQSGLAVALGWPGGWRLETTRDGAGRLHVELACGDSGPGRPGADLSLAPGEALALPPVIVGAYRGDAASG